MKTLERQREKMESLGQLAGGVAHELNNMLQPIFFAVDAIQKRAKDDDVIQASSKKIISCTTKAADIIEDILAFAREDSDHLCFINMKETFEHALSFSKDLLPKTIQVSLSPCPKSDYWAWMNETDMVRLLTNLLTNAADSMEQKGKIDVKMDYIFVLKDDPNRPEIINDVLKSGRYACVSVADEGRGFPREEIERIFDPFYTTKEIGEGTGLGLSIVHNILKNWKGGVNVSSVEGKGTVFSLYIPVCRTET